MFKKWKLLKIGSFYLKTKLSQKDRKVLKCVDAKLFKNTKMQIGDDNKKNPEEKQFQTNEDEKFEMT